MSIATSLQAASCAEGGSASYFTIFLEVRHTVYPKTHGRQSQTSGIAQVTPPPKTKVLHLATVISVGEVRVAAEQARRTSPPPNDVLFCHDAAGCTATVQSSPIWRRAKLIPAAASRPPQAAASTPSVAGCVWPCSVIHRQMASHRRQRPPSAHFPVS